MAPSNAPHIRPEGVHSLGREGAAPPGRCARDDRLAARGMLRTLYRTIEGSGSGSGWGSELFQVPGQFQSSGARQAL